MRKAKQGRAGDVERYYVATQWQLMWRKLRKHRLAMFGLKVLALVYVMALFSEFFSTYDVQKRHPLLGYSPPQRIRVRDAEGAWRLPFR
jgi:peptide/nickel transport system permease protein